MKKFMTYVERVINELERLTKSELRDGVPLVDDFGVLMNGKLDDVRSLLDMLARNEKRVSSELSRDEKYSAVNELNETIKEAAVKIIIRLAMNEVLDEMKEQVAHN